MGLSEKMTSKTARPGHIVCPTSLITLAETLGESASRVHRYLLAKEPQGGGASNGSSSEELNMVQRALSKLALFLAAALRQERGGRRSKRWIPLAPHLL